MSLEILSWCVQMTFEGLYKKAGNSSSQDYSTFSKNDPLEFNFLLIRNSGNITAIVSCDFLYAGKQILQLCRKILKNIVDPNLIFLFASHTHNAPLIDPTKYRLGVFSTELFSKISNLVELESTKALNKSEWQKILRIEYCESHPKLGARRRYTNKLLKKFGLLSAKSGISDEQYPSSLICVKFFNEEGKLSNVVWTFNCHPVGLSHEIDFSSHYIGVIRKSVRKNNPNLSVIFIQGFSGDIRPSSSSTNKPNNKFIKRIFYGKGYSDFSLKDYIEWVGNLKAHFETMQEKQVKYFEDLSFVRTKVTKVPVNNFFRVKSKCESLVPNFVELMEIDFGNYLRIFGINGEIVSTYIEKFESFTAPENVIYGSCMNHVIGYFPDDKMISEGGYESRTSCKFFNLKPPKLGLENRLIMEYRKLNSLYETEKSTNYAD